MMTKLRKIILIPALSIVFISGFFSCGVDRWPESDGFFIARFIKSKL